MFHRHFLSSFFRKLLIIATLVCLLHITKGVNGQPNFISTTSRGYTSTEEGMPFFSCLRSDPDLDATVSTGRYAYTLNSPPSNSPPPPNWDLPVLPIGNPPTDVYITHLDRTPHKSFGVFYCASSKNNKQTVVPVIFLRSNARFLPAGGRFSQTVNAGDEDVTVEFIQVSVPDTIRKVWRRNGTLDSREAIDVYDSTRTHYTIVGEVNPSHAGVYELHANGERAQARAGLIILIVRACPAGRYDASSGCVRTCSSCYNGGICDDGTGHCICPPGFQGASCEIGCGGNRYGRLCEYRCDYDNDDDSLCSGLQVCVPDPYGCSCTPGFKGVNCTTVCDSGEFGASCSGRCHCVSGECDRFTGECTGNRGDCQSEWTGNNCQECITGRYGPDCAGTITITSEDSNENIAANITCSLEGGTYLSTADPVVKLYRRFGQERMHDEGISLSSSVNTLEGLHFDFQALDVTDGEIFFCTLSDVNNFRSEEVELQIHAVPQLPSPPVVSATTNTSVTLMWDAWNERTDVGDPPLVGYYVYYKENTSLHDLSLVNKIDELAPSEKITSLNPDTDYMFAVAAVRPGPGGAGRRLVVEGSTDCSPPTSGPSSPNATDGIAPGQVMVSWQNPSTGSNCRSGFTNCKIYYTLYNDDQSVRKKRSVHSEQFVTVPLDSAAGYNLSSLQPYSTYTIAVVILNKDAESARSSEVIASTIEEIAPPPMCTITANSTAIVVRWTVGEPPNVNGYIQEYHIRYIQTKPTIGTERIISINRSQLTGNVYVITDVVKGSTYDVQVRIVNGVGPSDWSPVSTGRAADPRRSNLALIAGLITGILLLVLLILVIVVFILRRRKKKEKAPVELVDNELYETSIPSNKQNSNSDVYIRDKPLTRNPERTEYAYVIHERNSLLSEDMNSLDLVIQKEMSPKVERLGMSPTEKSLTLPLLSTASSMGNHATPDKRSDVQSVPSLSPILKEAGTDSSDMDIYENVTTPPAIAIENLVEYVESRKMKDKDGFAHDFSLLPSDEMLPQTVASKPENKFKNRFKNIVAYDHSRVVLEPLSDNPHSDYYNANYINDHKGRMRFIAAQAPNSASINDFWRLILQENVCTIVMVTNTVEGGKDRCMVYWPKEMGNKAIFGQIEVTLRTIEEFSDHFHRIVDVRKLDGSQSLCVHQFHYVSWPDMGVPQYPTTLISFSQSVKHIHNRITANAKGSTPLLVHCSAGVGRTGTFIALDCLLDQLREERRVNIFGLIKQMRNARPKMVQTVDQYIFLHTALVEAYMSGNTDVSVSLYEAKLASLQQRNSETNKLNIEQEFEILGQLTPPARPEAFKAAVLPGNIDKNRFQNILPMERNRPCLITSGTAGSTDYINASFLNTFMKKDVFIATQMPLPHTTGDIWRLAYDWKCPAIVMLNELDQADKSCAQYWPDQDSVKFGPLTVSIVSAETRGKDFIVREFKVEESKQKTLTVKQFQLLGWGSKQDIPDSVSPLLAIVDVISSSAHRSCSSGPIIIHCINGVGRSGVFAAIYSAAEKLISDGSIDIFQAVKRLRANRTNMVETVEQYKLCYHVMAEHMKRFDEYANLDMAPC